MFLYSSVFALRCFTLRKFIHSSSLFFQEPVELNHLYKYSNLQFNRLTHKTVTCISVSAIPSQRLTAQQVEATSVPGLCSAPESVQGKSSAGAEFRLLERQARTTPYREGKRPSSSCSFSKHSLVDVL